MSALRFTARGAVSAPATVQIRIAPEFEGRVGFGAPVPARPMTEAEVRCNISHFRHPGPRAHPVTRVVLSGVPEGMSLRGIVGHALEQGVTQVVAHLRPGATVDDPRVRVACAVRSEAECEALARGRPLPSVTVPLEEEVLPRLRSILARLADIDSSGVTLVWPYPHRAGKPPPPAAAVVAALGGVGAELGTLNWGIKGLPRCTLRAVEGGVSLDGRIWPTANRYYVDAEHQAELALLLRPDLLEMAKVDTCRFCKEDHRCDGVAGEWLRAGLTGGLSPVEDGLST